MMHCTYSQPRACAQAKQRLKSFAAARKLSVRCKSVCNTSSLDSLYCFSDVTPTECTGPVQIVSIPGRGRGVTASVDIGPGQVVMLSRPFAYVACPMGDIPSADELAEKIRATCYTQDELRTLLSLYDGEDDEEKEQNGHQPGYGDELDDFKLYGIIGCNSFGEEFKDFPTALAWSTRPHRSEAAPPGSTTGITCNTYTGHASASTNTARTAGPSGEAEKVGQGGGTDSGSFPHPSTSTLPAPNSSSSSQPQQQQPPPPPHQVGHLGLFPSFSMLNHSCLPNAVNFVVGDHMMVVAARHIPKGSEVQINYLGRASLRPVAERQGQLAEGYHFACDCPRCRVELLSESAPAGAEAGVGRHGSFSEDVQALLERCKERSATLDRLQHRPDLPAAASAAAATPAPDDGGVDTALDNLLAAVRQDVQELDELVQLHSAVVPAEAAPGASPSARQLWLHASAFDLASQHVTAAEAAGRREEAVEALKRQVAVCEAVAPCSDLHMYLAVKLLSLEQAAAGAGSPRAVQQLQRCVGVLRGRYGAELSEGTIEVLLRGAAYGLSQVVV